MQCDSALEKQNRLHEQKAWASSATAKTMQAQFICMTHHLMTLLEAQMMTEEAIRNEAEQKRRGERIVKQARQTRAAGHGKLPFDTLVRDWCRESPGAV